MNYLITITGMGTSAHKDSHMPTQWNTLCKQLDLSVCVCVCVCVCEREREREREIPHFLMLVKPCRNICGYLSIAVSLYCISLHL